MGGGGGSINEPGTGSGKVQIFRKSLILPSS